MLRIRTHLGTLLVLLMTASLVAGVAAATTVSVNVGGHASHDGDTPINTVREGGSEATVTADTDGNVEATPPHLVGTLRGIAAYIGFLSDGAQGGNAGLWGSATVDGEGCSFQTWGGPVDPANTPSVSCGILP